MNVHCTVHSKRDERGKAGDVHSIGVQRIRAPCMIYQLEGEAGEVILHTLQEISAGGVRLEMSYCTKCTSCRRYQLKG